MPRHWRAAWAVTVLASLRLPQSVSACAAAGWPPRSLGGRAPVGPRLQLRGLTFSLNGVACTGTEAGCNSEKHSRVCVNT